MPPEQAPGQIITDCDGDARAAMVELLAIIHSLIRENQTPHEAASPGFARAADRVLGIAMTDCDALRLDSTEEIDQKRRIARGAREPPPILPQCGRRVTVAGRFMAGSPQFPVFAANSSLASAQPRSPDDAAKARAGANCCKSVMRSR
jgi:hypothetical protein